MQIASVLSRLSDLAHPKTSEPAEPARPRSANQEPAATASSSAASDAMRRILAEYDVTSISPRAFSEMLQKLNQLGALTDRQFQDLSLLRLELDRDGIEPDQRLNLVDFCQRKLKEFREGLNDAQDRSGTVTGVQGLEAPIERRLAWLQKFAAIHAEPASVNQVV